jgi:mannose/fructose/N-acetylgalactosamine-specific phosphotransferase system component IIC
MLSRPIIAAALTGALLGDFTLGLLLGLWTEFVFLRYHPIGTKVRPSCFVCAIFSVILVNVYRFEIPTAFFISFIISAVFSQLDAAFRKLSSRFNESIEFAIKQRAENINAWVAKIISFRFSFVFLFLFLGSIAAGNGLVFTKSLPQYVDLFMLLLFMTVPILGLINFLIIFAKKNG